MNMTRLGGSRMKEPFGDGHKRKCPICGAKFICHVGWAYRSSKYRGKGAVYCSYKCFRVWERKEEEKIKARIAKTDAFLDGEKEWKRLWQEQKRKKEKAAREKECVGV